MRTPITLLRKIVAQCIVTRCCALLSIHPIKNNDALLLDKQLAGKIHSALGFPYRGNTDILTLPVEQHGLEFPSIARINMGLVAEGLARDLKYHIPAYQHIAHITLADWTRRINSCIMPLDGISLKWNFSQYYKKTPAAWIIAQNTRMNLKQKLSLCLTDNSHIVCGEISISHTFNLCKAHRNDIPNGHAIQSITTKGIDMLSHVGHWTETTNGSLTFNVRDSPAPLA